MAYEIYCKNCGRKLLKYEKYERKYKSPVACCKKCGKEYIDPRCHELAIEGIPEAEFKVTNGIILFIIGVLIAWRGFYLFGMRMLGTPDSMQWLMPSAILLLGLAMIIGAIIDLIRILTGSKKRRYERLLEESKVRISSDEYIWKLKNLGYLREGVSE